MKTKTKNRLAQVAETVAPYRTWKARVERIRINQAAFCRKIGLAPETFCRFLAGSRVPRPEVAIKIESALLKEEEIFSRL